MDFSADFRSSNRGPKKGSSLSLKNSINDENISSNIDNTSSSSSSSSSILKSNNNNGTNNIKNSINNDINNDTITIINDNDINIDWITSQLDKLGYSSSLLSSLSLNDTTLTIIQRLLKVNDYIDDNNKKQQSINTLMKNRDSDANTIEQLRGDVANANNKIAMMSIEHREVKSHWLQEKSQLESRLFQMQALKTQVIQTNIFINYHYYY